MTDKEKKGEDQGQKYAVKLTLTCKQMKTVEKVCSELIQRAKQVENVKVKGPIRMPTKTLRITCRKTPCGEGSKTWDRWEMRIYKRIINLVCYDKDIREITKMKMEPGVEIELSINEVGSKEIK